MHHSTSTTGRPWRLRAPVAAVAAGLLVVVAPVGTATAELGEPEPSVPVRGGQWEWVDGPMHELDDPCSDNGPGGDASDDCGGDDDIDEPSSDVPWGGPGERVAVGRDRDLTAAQREAETEAAGVCHGDWDLRDVDQDHVPPGPWVYTLTYECD